MNFELPPEDMGAAMKPQQMVDLLEEHIVGQVRAMHNMGRWKMLSNLG